MSNSSLSGIAHDNENRHKVRDVREWSSDNNNNNNNNNTAPQHPVRRGSDVSNFTNDTPHPLTLEQLDQRLTVVETLLAAQSQLASHSFASNGSLHMSDFLQSTQSSIMSGNQLSVTQPLEATNAASVNGSATTLLLPPPPPYPPQIFTPPQEGEGVKRRKTKKQKRQKKTKKRGNKGKRLTKRNRK